MFLRMLPTALQSLITTASGRFQCCGERMSSFMSQLLPQDDTPFAAM